MEEDIGFHWGEEGEARDLGSLVQELGFGDLAIGALFASLADNEFDQVHLLDHVLEGSDVGVRDLAAQRDVAERGQVLQQVVRQLVLGRLADDALKVLRLDVAVAVLVELQEGLADTLALQTTQHLGELLVGQGMAAGLVANVQLGPLAVPVEGDAVGAFVQLAQAAEVLVLDTAGAVDVKQAEGNLVLCIRLGQQVVEGGPVGEADFTGGFAIGDTEEEAILLTLDFAL